MACLDNSSDNDSEDDELPRRVNANHDEAAGDLNESDLWKKKKYLPTINRTKCTKILLGNDEEGNLREILVGPVLKRGKNLTSGKKG